MRVMWPIGRVLRYSCAIALPLGLAFCASQCTTGVGTSILDVHVKGTLVFESSGRPVSGAWVTAFKTPAARVSTSDALDNIKWTREYIAAYVAHDFKGESRPAVEEVERLYPAGQSLEDGSFEFTHSVWRCEGTRRWPILQTKRAPMHEEVRSLWIQTAPNAPPVVIDIHGATWTQSVQGWEGSLDLGVVRVPAPR